jgi:hypothetical protein
MPDQKTWWNFPSPDVLAGKEEARGIGPILQKTAEGIARLMSSSGDIGPATKGQYPIAFLKATRTPIYDVSGNEPNSKAVYGYEGNTLGSVGSKGPRNVVLLNIKDRTAQQSDDPRAGQPGLEKVLSHEAIHVSQNMNQAVHDKAAAKFNKTLPWRALDNYIQQVYSSDEPKNETEAFIGSSTMDPSMMQYLKTEGVTPEQLQSLQGKLTSQYPQWLRLMQKK